jgi:DsbC/DsbD-like thiol-disulfide interchange protein
MLDIRRAMIEGANVRRRALLAAAAAALAGPARAAPPPLPARVRLLGALARDGGRLLAGVHVVLDPGWKTYWRVPGDSGFPPRFDWSRSANLAAAEVLFPAPARLSDGSGEILGYEHEVVLPVEVAPREASRPVDLALTLDFGVCERLCIPAQTSARLSIGRASPPARDAELLNRHLARVPKAVPKGVAVVDWRADVGAGLVRFSARLEGGVDHAVVESTSGAALPLPRLERRADGTLAARLDVARAQPPLGRGAGLLVTVVGPARAVEELHGLD